MIKDEAGAVQKLRKEIGNLMIDKQNLREMLKWRGMTMEEIRAEEAKFHTGAKSA